MLRNLVAAIRRAPVLRSTAPSSVLCSALGAIALVLLPQALGQTEVYRWNGEAPNIRLGTSVASAGDVDNDGYGDVLIGAPYESGAFQNNGSATVRSGRTGGVIHKWFGDAANDHFGNVVAGLGDLNGDGCAEVIVGTITQYNGSAYVGGRYARVFSGQSGLPLYTLSGDAPQDNFGMNVANLGDLDNDGKSEIGVMSGLESDNYVNVYSGASGSLLFAFHPATVNGELGSGMAGIGDLDEDGHGDFALSDPAALSEAGQVAVYSGHAGSTYYTIDGAAPGNLLGTCVANAGDVDNDGKDDLVIGSLLLNAAGRVSVHSGADGALMLSRNGEAAGDFFGTNCVSIGDEDGDGRPDFAISAIHHNGIGPNSGRVYALSSASLSTIFTLDGEAASNNFGIGLGAGDITDDGWPELLIGASYNDAGGVDAGAAYVYTTHTGTCSTTLPHYTVGATPRDVLLVDRDGDGDRDIMSADSGAGTLSILTNDGAGGFGGAPLSIVLAPGDDPTSITLQGTGLAVACPTTNRIRLLGKSGNTWTYSGLFLTFPGNRPADIVSADLNGSNGPNDDLVFALEGSLFGVGGGVATSIGGEQVMLPAPPGGFLSVKRVAVGDLDGDGDQDIVAGMTGTAFTTGPATNLLLYANNGSGAFSYAGALTGGGVPSGLAVRDIDGDGDSDLVVSVQNVPPFTGGNGVKVFKNGGSGPLAPARFTDLGLLAAGSLPGDVAAADLDADSLAGFISHEDVVVADTTGSALKTLRSFGSTSFASSEDLEADDTPVALAIADLDGDGVPDIVAANAACDCVSVTLSPLTALTQKFGTGCAGTGGKVPAISAVGSPTFGNPAFGVKLTNGRAASFVFFGISLSYINAPLGGGCTLFLNPPVSFYSTFTNSIGQTQIGLPIPNAVPPFVGLNAYFQYFVNDPVGGYSGFAFSDALRIRLGS